jgi:hypothetical protein
MISVRKYLVFKYHYHRSKVADSESYKMNILDDFKKRSQRKERREKDKYREREVKRITERTFLCEKKQN